MRACRRRCRDRAGAGGPPAGATAPGGRRSSAATVARTHARGARGARADCADARGADLPTPRRSGQQRAPRALSAGSSSSSSSPPRRPRPSRPWHRLFVFALALAHVRPVRAVGERVPALVAPFAARSVALRAIGVVAAVRVRRGSRLGRVVDADHAADAERARAGALEAGAPALRVRRRVPPGQQRGDRAGGPRCP